MENTNTEIQQQKSKIKEYFIDISDDKFTNIRVVKCKQPFVWKGMQLANCFMPTAYTGTHSLELKIDYRHKEQVDSIFFVFRYENIDDGFAGLNNLTLYLILDENKTLILDSVSNRDTYSDTRQNAYGSYETIYIEQAQLSISTSEYIQIVNSSKIDYSIRFGSGKFDSTFTQRDLNILKGFYSATFDEDFETNRLFEFLNSADSKVTPTTKSEGCYIATMTYGNYEHPKVIFLRQFRDSYLSNYFLGRKFIDWYYRNSPIWVMKLRNKKTINLLIKKNINLVIAILKLLTSSFKSKL